MKGNVHIAIISAKEPSYLFNLSMNMNELVPAHGRITAGVANAYSYMEGLLLCSYMHATRLTNNFC